MSRSATTKEPRMDRRILVPLLMMAIMEYEIFTFSKAAVAAARQDAWISVLVGAAIGGLFIYIFVKLAARFPDLGYFQYLKVVWGKYIGFMISILYLLFWVVFLCSMFYETKLANSMLFLPQTPAIIPLMIFALTLIWLISNGFNSLVRFLCLLFPFLVIPLVILAVLFIPAIRIDNFLPIYCNGMIPILKGSFYSLGAYQGPEVLLFAAPFIMKINKAVKPTLLAFTATIFFGWTNTVAAVGILGVANIKDAVLPGISVVNILQFPGFPVERFGLLLTLPWLTAIYTTLAVYLYLFCTNTIELFHQQQRKKLMILILTLIPVIMAYFLPNENWHEKLRLYLMVATVPIVYILPAMTFLLAVIRKKGKRT